MMRGDFLMAILLPEFKIKDRMVGNKEQEGMVMNKIYIERCSTQAQLQEVAELAEVIWHEYFPFLLSKDQIDYMVEKFQTNHKTNTRDIFYNIIVFFFQLLKFRN